MNKADRSSTDEESVPTAMVFRGCMFKYVETSHFLGRLEDKNNTRSVQRVEGAFALVSD